MKNNLILLAEIIATDNDFAKSFYSKPSIEEKFKLAKTKFVDLRKEDFVEFYNELQELEKLNMKLSLSDLENVSGGIGNSKLKLAALAFLGLALTPMVTSNMVSADFKSFYSSLGDEKYSEKQKKGKSQIGASKSKVSILTEDEDKYETNNLTKKGEKAKEIVKLSERRKGPLHYKDDDDDSKISKAKNGKKSKTKTDKRKQGKNSKSSPAIYDEDNFVEQNDETIKSVDQDAKKIGNQNQYYKNITKGLCKKILGDGSVPKKIDMDDGIVVDSDKIMHIILGDYDKKYSYHKEGGHTIYALNCLKYINDEKLKEDNNNPFREIYKEQVLNGVGNAYEVIEEFNNGVKKCKYFDSLKSTRDCTATVFPKNWFNEAGQGSLDAISRKLKLIAEKCLKDGQKLEEDKEEDKTVDSYIALINGVFVKTVVGKKDKKIRSIYPLEKQITPRETQTYNLSELGLTSQAESTEVKLDNIILNEFSTQAGEESYE